MVIDDLMPLSSQTELLELKALNDSLNELVQSRTKAVCDSI
jgi:hypothetical protein